MNKIESAKLDTEEILHNREQLSDISAPYYKALRNEVAIFEHAYKCRLPILLKGPTGTGKTRFVAYMAHLLGRNLIFSIMQRRDFFNRFNRALYNKRSGNYLG